MGQNDRDELQIFEDIIRGQEMRDAGIVTHDAEIREFEAYLREQYVEKGFVEIPPEDFDALTEKINKRWPYYEQYASLTGRLELVNDEEAAVLYGVLGAIATPDANGEVIHSYGDDDIAYVNVDQVRLESQGIHIDAVCDDNGKLCDVRVGYVFYHPDDRDGLVPLFATPDALIRHNYDIPSPAEARVRLEHQWPEQLEIIDATMHSDAPLPHRIMAVAESLKQELTDATFRELVELYINEDCALDAMIPYMTLVKNRIDIVDDIESEDGAWHKLEIEGALTIFIINPEIRFASATDDIGSDPEAFIFGTTFNDEYGDKPEMVAIPAKNFERFLSTRASTSLAERALESFDRQIDEDMQAIVENKNTLKFAEVAEDDDGTPEYIRQLEILEDVFHRIQKIGDEYLKHTFSTREDAERDAAALLEKMKEHLNGTLYASGAHIVEVMGSNISVANFKYNLHLNEENVLMHGVDTEKPVVELPLGDKVVGNADAFYAVVTSTLVAGEEEEGGVVFYTPRIVLGVVTEQGVASTVSAEPVLSELSVRNRASVPIDSSSDITFSTLEQYRDTQSAIEQAEKIYGVESPLMQRINQLHEVFNKEDPNDYTHLEPAVISRFAVDLGRVVRRHRQPIEPALAVLEAMIGKRNIIAKSAVYKKTQDGALELDTERSDKTYGWKVIDLTPEQNGHEIMMLVSQRPVPGNGENYRYIPMTSVTEFQF